MTKKKNKTKSFITFDIYLLKLKKTKAKTAKHHIIKKRGKCFCVQSKNQIYSHNIISILANNY